MRPRKKVLVFSALETDIGATIFVLNNQLCGWLRSLHARAVHSFAEFVEQLDAFAPDAVLLFHDGSPSPTLQCCAAAHKAGIPRLLVVRSGEIPAGHCAGMVLGKKQSNMAEILDGLRIVLARKRGPKPAHSGNDAKRAAAGMHAAECNARLA